jgi:hypothetical protein
MKKPLTIAEYKSLQKPTSNAEPIEDIDVSTSKTERLLREMGDYFELPPKSVTFWIKQMKLSGRV